MYFRVFGQNMIMLRREILAEDNAKKIGDATENEVKAFSWPHSLLQIFIPNMQRKRSHCRT